MVCNLMFTFQAGKSSYIVGEQITANTTVNSPVGIYNVTYYLYTTSSVLVKTLGNITTGSDGKGSFTFSTVGLNPTGYYVYAYTIGPPTCGSSFALISLYAGPNITATSMVLNKTSCAEPCTVGITITWRNNGDFNGSFYPAIIVDGRRIASTTLSTLGPGVSVVRSFIILSLSYGVHNFCPDPN